jgi:hypothetical protein
MIKQVKVDLAGSLHEWTNKLLEKTGHNTIIIIIIIIIRHLYAGHLQLYAAPSCNIRNFTQFFLALKKLPLR